MSQPKQINLYQKITQPLNMWPTLQHLIPNILVLIFSFVSVQTNKYHPFNMYLEKENLRRREREMKVQGILFWKLAMLIILQIHQKVTFSPCSRAMEAERIPRSRFKKVNADSHSEIILVTDEGSPAIVSDDPTARAACESLRFLKLPKNCNWRRTKEFPLQIHGNDDPHNDYKTSILSTTLASSISIIQFIVGSCHNCFFGD